MGYISFFLCIRAVSEPDHCVIRRDGGATTGSTAAGLASETEMAEVSGFAALMACGDRLVSTPASVSIISLNPPNRSPLLSCLPPSHPTSPAMSQTKQKPRRRGANLPGDAPLANPSPNEQDLLDHLVLPKFGCVLPPANSHCLLSMAYRSLFSRRLDFAGKGKISAVTYVPDNRYVLLSSCSN